MGKVAIVEFVTDAKLTTSPQEEGITEWADWYTFGPEDDRMFEIKDLAEHYDIVLYLVDGKKVSRGFAAELLEALSSDYKIERTGAAHD